MLYIYICLFYVNIYKIWICFYMCKEQKGWPRVASLFLTLVVLYRMFAIITQHETVNVWNIIPRYIHLPTPLYVSVEGHTVGTKDKTIFKAPHIRFTYSSEDNQRGCSRLIFFVVVSLGPWMNHLIRVCWYIFVGLYVWNGSWCSKVIPKPR